MAATREAVELEAVYPAQPPAIGRVRHDGVEAARSCGASESALPQIQLAVSEAATNVVLHAYRDGLPRGEMRVVLRQVDDCIDVSIRDDGVGMSPRGDSPGAGFGLGLMAHAADRCVITSEPGEGTDVLLRFELSR
jgi:serine/threonine-protein kinase RsbW